MEEESQMIGPQTLGAKMPFFPVEKLGKESSVFGQKSAEKDADLRRLREGHSPIKREKEIWTLKLVKDKYNLNCFPFTNS